MQLINFAANTAAFWADSSLQELSIKNGFILTRKGDFVLNRLESWVLVLRSLGYDVRYDKVYDKVHVVYKDSDKWTQHKNPLVFTYFGNGENQWDNFNNLSDLLYHIEKYFYVR